MLHFSGQQIFRKHSDADFHRSAKNAIDGGQQDDHLALLDRVDEIQFVDGGRHAYTF